MISSKFTTLRNGYKSKTNTDENKLTKKSNSKHSKTKNNVSSIESHTQKHSNKKRTSTSKNNKKKSQSSTVSNEKPRNSKQNWTPSKKDTQIFQMIALQLGQENKKGVAAIKNIKNKIIGDKAHNSGNKVPQPMALKQIFIDNKQSVTTPNNVNDLFRTNLSSHSIAQSKFIIQKSKDKDNLTIQNFQFLKKLGKGRFGDVYFAKDSNTGFLLAIKMINKIELHESQMQNQLIQQIKTQIYCNHPNILKMYGYFSDEINIYLLLEYGTHGCLFDQLRQKNYFPEDYSCHYFRQITSGVKYLHSHSILHRDIKPQNIVNCFGVLKICDFGWAVYSPIYQRQTFCGTLDYVSPQIITGQFYDEKVDIWCLGVLCYELCTGKPPFQSMKKDKLEVYSKILNVQIQFSINLSLSVVDLIGKILHRDPKQRYCLQQIQSHEWMKTKQNETGCMIKKQIWDGWVKIFI